MPAGAAGPRGATEPAGPGGVRVPELTLSAALALMPDTYDIRGAGVWYADYARAARAYGVGGIDSMMNPRIDSYFKAILPLHSGPETGLSSLSQGVWRRTYGYDLLQLTSEIYSVGAPSVSAGPSHLVGVAVGGLDTTYIAHLLATTGYTATTVSGDRLYTRATSYVSMPTAAMNAVSPRPGELVAGPYVADVTALLLHAQQGTTLGRNRGFAALAEALGSVQGAYLRANVPPPFPLPRGGHRGRALRPFGQYAVAYAEPRPGERYMDIALAYTRRSDALADAPTLRARLDREGLPTYGVSWRSLVDVASVTVPSLDVRGESVLLIRLRPRPSAPPTLWQDAAVEEDLALLSR